MRVFSTAKISERHQHQLIERFSHTDFLFFDNISDLYRQTAPPFAGVDILITYGEDLSKDSLSDFPDLKWIQVISAGLEKLPLKEIANENIRVTNARGIHQVPMGEYTMAAMLQILRRTGELIDHQKSSTWDRTIRVDELFGKTISIIGFGAIGEAIAKRAKAFDANIIGVNSTGQPHPFADEMHTLEALPHVLGKSDFVVIALPLTPNTTHLFNRRMLETIKSDACLINIARGDVIVEEDLIEVLREQVIAGAVLDVFSEEPLPETHPFWQMDNVIVTPHLSGRSPHYMERALNIFSHNMAAFEKQADDAHWINVIDLVKGY